MHEKYLIVTADDFGLSSNINYGIITAIQKGIVCGVSLTANGDAFNEALQLIKTLPHVSVGVHLSLVDGRPILSSSEVSSLVNNEGLFPRSVKEFAAYYAQGRYCIKEVARELEAQVVSVKEAGIEITHLDSHQHTHCFPGIFKQVTAIANKYKIPYVRLPKEPFELRGFLGKPKRVLEQQVLGYLAGKCRDILLRSSIKSADHFRGFFDGGSLTKSRLLSILLKLKPGITELMCHPGYNYDGVSFLQPAEGWNYLWEEELKALTDPEVMECIAANGIKLCSFSSGTGCRPLKRGSSTHL